MKTKIFMALTFALMSVCSLQAQNQEKKEKKERVFPNEQMIKELNLTDKQVAKLKEGETELKAQMKALREKNELSKKEMKESMIKMKDARKDLLRKSMTTEQYITFLELKVERLEKMNFKKGQKQFGRRGHRPQGPQRQFAPEGQGPQKETRNQ